ncbi:hypothetical protein ROZALSC1DRAFT_28316 [Rozella allomycis CSF55]|uniref:Ion transport domain-containing protein n=1 Tax=Rozella allomycis (strain CSF55) TaxID=988480 RepID=A0A075B263_ROZAC|nr:Ion transport domain-containing protein [Rozella allomycis CSF55]RKP20167.1 hypothetical protein ROZALSC1DRAFT_28316 [Rozella allomycis CSF55]|eukprot:EPZ34913.1 Ion transport domain-containing protein [Rozella allomycis CSF55]
MENTNELAEQIGSNTLQRISKVFHDLSMNTHYFRSKLLEEFQLVDSLTDESIVQTPIYASRDITDSNTRDKVLENPNQLIKFKIFRREKEEVDLSQIDRRLTRTKNIYSLPIGAWAGWVVKNKWFSGFMLSLILLNSVLFALEVELSSQQKDYWVLFQAIQLIDIISIIFFYIEVVLMWTDNFKAYWKNGWNIFDLTLLSLSTLPRLFDLFAYGSSLSAASENLRIFRVVRCLKIVTKFDSLKVIVLTLLGTMRSMMFILLLLFVVAYIYAILAINLFDTSGRSKISGSLEFFDGRWATLGDTLQTLFQILTLDRWLYILRELSLVINPVLAYIYGIVWVWLGAFIFRNLFIGIMVNNFEKIAEKVREQQAETQKLKKFENLRRKLNKELFVQKTINKDLQTENKEKLKDSKPLEDPSKIDRPGTADQFNLRTINENSKKIMRRSSYQEGVINHPNVPDQSKGTFAAPKPKKLRGILTREFSNDNEKSEVTRDGNVTSPIDSSGSNKEDVVGKITEMLSESHGISKDWEKTVTETLNALYSTSIGDTYWPRDTIFRYFRTMETLQENMKEYQELQSLMVQALLDLHDD